MEDFLVPPTTFNSMLNELKKAIWYYDHFHPIEISDNLSADERLVIERGLENILAPLSKEKRKLIYEAAVNLAAYYEQHDGGP